MFLVEAAVAAPAAAVISRSQAQPPPRPSRFPAWKLQKSRLHLVQ
jgi:hypothetical protein